MTIKYNLIKNGALFNFAEHNNLTFVVKERENHIPSKHMCYVSGVEFSQEENGVFDQIFGDGFEISEAFSNLIEQISGKWMSVGEYSKNRKKVKVPTLHFEKPIHFKIVDVL